MVMNDDGDDDEDLNLMFNSIALRSYANGENTILVTMYIIFLKETAL
jgi:hypothetical protein